ncbi:muts domain V-domain-containing protein [Abortiporus biennis]|nr:muts domain V-domain-containing protein [Abortiporus biennis]
MPTQPTISSFFSQSPRSKKNPRQSSPIDLTIDSASDSEPRAKKRKISSSFFTSSAPKNSLSNAKAGSSRLPSHDAGAGAAEKYRFNPTQTAVSTSKNSAEPEVSRKRRERAKKILLGNQNAFCNDVDSEQPGQDEDDTQPAEESLPDVAEPEDSGDDSDEKFKDTLAFFANSNSTSRGSKKQGRTKSQPLSRKKKVEEIGPSGLPHTPMELQIRNVKKKHPGVLLMFEVGYKYYFYGEDATVAAQTLGIIAYQKRNFLTAGIPVHRREVHLKKLLSQGHKVGVIAQTETAALKKISETRNDVFARDLTHLYTAATYVDTLNSVDDTDRTAAPPMMCLVEELRGGMGVDERVRLSMIAISPSTGDVVWDEFEDNHMRTELETRIIHTSPCELLLPAEKLSKPTEKMLAYCNLHSTAEHKTRIERYDKSMSYTEAFSLLSKVYGDKDKDNVENASQGFKSGRLMAAISGFPKGVVRALAQAVRYLSSFNVADALLETEFFSKFTERTHMLLNANTLTNLEIYRNETDYKKRGSLMWILDHTTTRFGARMLRSWIGRPLVDKVALKERTDAMEEILSTQSPKITTLRQLLKTGKAGSLPDLARGLCRIQYGKCTPQELADLLPAFNKIGAAFEAVENSKDVGFKSDILNDVIATLPKLKEPMKALLGEIKLAMCADGRKEAMWTDPDKFPDIDGITMSIQILESELMDELRAIRKTVKKPALQYTTSNGEEYVVELKKSENRDVPVDWVLLSSTKTVRRYHPPTVKEKLQQRAQWMEALQAEADKAYQQYLAEISHNHYGLLRDAVNKLAVVDCLFSLAQVALQDGYVRPTFCEDEDVLDIVDARHPMIEALRDEPFVPNTIRMGGDYPRSKIITGPNMGGKSSAVRMIALCAIMAQIGSYVPAKSMRMSTLDGILIRMGASDELARGRSTFMVEMQETSEILHIASKKSLVILDELGRGTSTFDGMAVASAVLHHLTETIKCKTLFITHYPQVASDIERRFPTEIENVHMAYAEYTHVNGVREVTFLYEITPGITLESFGVECARLAGLSEHILEVASTKSQVMRKEVEERVRKNKSASFHHVTSSLI